MRGVHSTSAPCNALCTVLVTAKNSSLPCITSQSASMPTLRRSGTCVASSSATPPPYAVALRCRIARALQGLRELEDLVDDVDADDARVVGELPFEEGNAFEQAMLRFNGGRGRVGGCGRCAVRCCAWPGRAGDVPSNSAPMYRGARASPHLGRRVPRQVPRHARRAPRPPPRWLPVRAAPASRPSGSCRSPTAGRARSTRSVAALGGSRRVATVTGPLGDPVDADVGDAARAAPRSSRWPRRAGCALVDPTDSAIRCARRAGAPAS